MSREILKNIIEDFSTEKFINFFRSKNRLFRPLKENLTNYEDFTSGEKIGTIEFPDNNFIICAFKVIKELTERSGKKKQYELGKKILKETNTDAGIFIFYGQSGNFRFSLIYTEYFGTRRKFSYFKRFTYFVSPLLTNKTFLEQIGEGDFSSFEKIKEAFSVEKVTKQFFQEIANWYFWAMDKVEFPDDIEKDKEQRNAKNLIRLITRLIFIWFMKEKKLVPNTLFDKSFIDEILNYNDKTGSTYYKAILQNLFFATLNTSMKKDNPNSRIFVEEAKRRSYISDAYLEQGYYRYGRFIKNKELFLKQFENIPFLNGGLFESLDKGKDLRVDCFSDNPKNETRLKVPDELFFLDKEIEVDLSNYLDNGKNIKVTGLLEILNKYNFTIDENTPIDQDVALDPELLGKVFENLLASYNPETATTARKATGSYYTPREIVDYMVEESLIEYCKNAVTEPSRFGKSRSQEASITSKLRQLFDYSTDDNPFKDEPEITLKLIDTIEKIKILDPACGSGAFLMGILHKLVLALHKLDPENKIWKERLLKRVPAEIREETEKSLQNKSIDYIRKLGLIENCIYGVDIQEVAIQISKLRFFISLLVEQQIDDTKPNRDIRALPNLETKFVAANTLIGLNKPAQLGLVSRDVEFYEKELFKIREELFYTNSRKEKLALQKKEKQLRENLFNALKNSGFPNDVAEKITNWDPFDQNTHADWFDSEFMFNVKDGFDIVIGNPPYIDSENMVRQGLNEEREYISKNYYFARGNWDIYIAFFEKGFELLNNKGILTFITPDKWLTKPFGEEMRKSSISKISSLVRCGRDVFESSNVDAIISIFSEKAFNNNIIKIYQFQDDRIILKNSINKNILTPPYNLDFLFSDYLWLLLKIEIVSLKLSDFGKCENACATSDAYKLKPLIKELKDKTFDKEIFLKVINTGTIGKYSSKWGKGEMTYLGNKYVFPVVNKNEFIKTFNDTYKKRVFSPKIVIKGLTLLEACIDLEGLIIPGKSTLVVNAKDIPTLKLLLAIINSKLASFYLKEKYPSYTYNQGINFTKDMINSMPFPKISNEQQKLLIALVDQILSAKKQNPEADTSQLEKEIDRLVYELYDLTDEEIKIIER